jgi:hypothetical protein
MGERKKSIYDLERRLNGLPLDDFVREYAKAYFEADIDTIRKLQQLLLRQEISIDDSPHSGAPEAWKAAPLSSRPHLNSGTVALPEPNKSED